MQPAPTALLVGVVLAVGVMTCVVPWAAVGLVAVVGVAGWDAWRERGRGPRVRGLDEVVRLTEGREGKMRAEVSGVEQAPVRAMVMARGMALAEGVDMAARVEALAGNGVWEIGLRGRRRGRYRGMVCGLEWQSRWRMWRIRRWQVLGCEVCVYPDLRPGRRALLRSPVFRALTANRSLAVVGRGREFERLREYQAGDVYADVSWKATARRAFPVTRLYQAEQQQEIYFLVDHGRRSALSAASGRSQLDVFVEAALLGASAALEAGDHFGVLTFAGEVTGWEGAGSGRAHFDRCRERLLDLRPRGETPGYGELFAAVRTRLRKRSYLLLFTDVTERGLAEEMRAAATLVRHTHVLLAGSMLPNWGGDTHDAMAALAVAREQRRVAALGPRLRAAGIALHVLPAERFAAGTIEAYLEAKRMQTL